MLSFILLIVVLLWGLLMLSRQDARQNWRFGIGEQKTNMLRFALWSSERAQLR